MQISKSSVQIFETADQLVAACASDLVAFLCDAQRVNHRSARLVLTGGRLGLSVVSALADKNLGFEGLSVWIAWGDERFVPVTSSDSNCGEALRRFPGLAEMSHYRFPYGENLEECRDLADAELAQVLQPKLPGPLFDLVLLGIGEDGHVASIFPNKPEPEAGPNNLVAATSDAPKAPATRITLTETALNRSRAVWFMAAGVEKRNAVAGSLSDESIPAGRVRGLEETRWYLDQSSAPAAR